MSLNEICYDECHCRVCPYIDNAHNPTMESWCDITTCHYIGSGGINTSSHVSVYNSYNYVVA